MRLSITLAKLLVAGAVLLPVGSAADPAQWASGRDDGFGFRYAYPQATFAPIEGESKPSFHYFVSPASDAKLLFGAWSNKEGRTPDAFKQWLIANTEGYDEVTYLPRGRTWFVLSGYRGDNIYYEKVMFSCGGHVVNVFAIAYPVSERAQYDPIVERVEDSFKPGPGC